MGLQGCLLTPGWKSLQKKKNRSGPYLPPLSIHPAYSTLAAKFSTYSIHFRSSQLSLQLEQSCVPGWQLLELVRGLVCNMLVFSYTVIRNVWFAGEEKKIIVYDASNLFNLVNHLLFTRGSKTWCCHFRARISWSASNFYSQLTGFKRLPCFKLISSLFFEQ